MKLNPLSLLIIILHLTSCSSITSLAENANTKDKFDSKELYLEAICKRTNFTKEKLIILDDNGYALLINEVISKLLSTYYGIVDKSYFVSAEQLSIKSCSGQIVSLYQLFMDDSKDIKKAENSQITLLTNLNLDNSKNTLIFLYSYKLGRLYKSKIKNVITELQKEDNFDYRIISLDNNDINKK